MSEELKTKIKHSIDAYKDRLKTIGVEKITPEIILDAKISCETGVLPLKSLATVTIGEKRSLEIKVWDAVNRSFVESSLKKMEIISSLQTQKEKIICFFAEITEEERKKFVKHVKEITEEVKVSIKLLRQKEMDIIKKKKLSENQEKAEQKKVQEIIDNANEEAKTIFEMKEKSILK